ncbi:thioredoxin family protein [Mariprofundus sp. NF]|uniref:thioredoxin family protein n=1 Tax=Mariprofundus sp. NF TaxID=2608716 RepID=UPI0015A1AE44|nr:thioredoxin family protein [Mariprofundus sp. NF]NWF38458.1 thioredoxin family protein [Mariprofundus sp. NF]
MATVEITKENIKEEVDGSAISILDFWAPWCAPCKAFGPTFEAVSENHPDVLFGKINTQEQEQLGAHFNIRSIPTLMIIREGLMLYSEPGALAEKDLEALIAEIKALDMTELHAEAARLQAEQS